MGQEIVYCSRCLTRLISADFEAGKARRLGNQVACSECAQRILSEMSPREREATLLTESSTKARAVRDTTTRRSHLSSPSTRAVRAEVRHPAPESRRKSPLVPILVGAALVGGIAVLALLMSSGDASPPPPDLRSPERDTVKAAEIPPPPPVPPSETPAQREAKRLLDEARAIPAGELERKIAAYAAVLAKSGLTPLYRRAKEEHDALVKSLELRFPPALAELDAAAKPLRDAEEFRNAEEVYRAARSRHDVRSWGARVDGKIRDVRRQADALYEIVRGKAATARSRGETEAVEAFRAQVKKWGYEDLIRDLDARLGAVEAPVPPSAALEAYAPVWTGAMRLASARDIDGALVKIAEVHRAAEEEDLKKEAQVDKRLLERLRDLHREIRRVLSSWPRGRSLRLQYLDADRKLMEVEGPVLGRGLHRVEFADEKGSFFIEFDDVTSFGLADAYRSRRGRLSVWDARALAFGCLLEGDEEGAKELLKKAGKELPEKCWAYAGTAQAKLPAPEAREREARSLFYKAELAFREPARTAEAAVAYARLAEEYATTRIVSREMERVLERKGAGKEYVFFIDRIAALGTFKKTDHDKVGPCWLSDSMAPNLQENYVEFEFSALPETEYRCWVLAGGCCAETFRVNYQATDLTARNRENRNRRESAAPGAELAPELVHRIRYLKRNHADHGGPKEPARWEWMTVALPEYEAAGPKKVRLYNDQKGFGVAAVVVSSLRRQPPKKDELAELREKDRIESDPVADGLLGWWRLDELKGAIAGDASGGGYEGTFEGAPAWEEGKLGGALKLDGDDSVTVTHDGALNTYPVSISAWIRTAGSSGAVLNKYRSGSKNGYQLYLRSGELRAWYFKDDGNYVWDGKDGMNGGKVNDGKWRHVAFVVDDAGGRLYVDGVLKEERKWKGSPGAATTQEPVSLGLYPGTTSVGSHFKGVIDDVRLYGRALGEEEVKLLAEGDPDEARAAAEAAAADAAAGWTKLFDGETLDCLVSGSRNAWKVEDGAIVHVDGVDNAAQSSATYVNGEVRLRFEATGPTHFRFNVRQGGEGSAGVEWREGPFEALKGKPRELIVVFRGDEVEATLDGAPVPVVGNTAERSGRIQFNATGSGLRILGLDYRP